MASYSNYLYEMPWGFVRLRADEPQPEGFVRRWGVNIQETAQIEAGADIRIVRDEVVITPVEDLA